MEMKKVSSSNIAAVGYHAQTKTLRVEFLNGNIYEYADVPPGLSEQFVQSESAGRFFSQNVRNRYETKRVERDAA